MASVSSGNSPSLLQRLGVASKQPTSKKPDDKPKRKRSFPEIVPTSYTSKEVDIPESFLTSAPPDAKPITTSYIDFTKTTLPEYEGLYAVVLDNVLSPSECAQLLRLAELSAGAGDEGVENNGWRPALVNAGPGVEFKMTEYRNSDRIIWDSTTIAQRIWERCQQAPGGLKELRRIDNQPLLQGEWAVKKGDSWKVTRLNERLRFLRYGAGQYFRQHCDGPYETPDRKERTFYTLHLYLNDSVQLGETEGGSSKEAAEPLKGGATTFHAPRASKENERCLDVDPKAGRVLIFQHLRLLHSGADVAQGTKYTLRSDLMFERALADKEDQDERRKSSRGDSRSVE
ncbi:MAG: hypothetical protein M1837_004415 [Sclerophora amabilis]|nr:MAG: hypothetical protein M1837_004415 [Sclerophora amabilis]